jgi:hypothetical protein
MKQIIAFFLACAILATACNSKKKTVEVKNDDGTSKATINADNAEMQKASLEYQKQAEELQKLSPVTMDELKAMVPEQMMGAKRSSFQANTATGTGVVTAEYDLNDTTNVRVTIWDCGGPAGSGLYSAQYMTAMNYQQESDNDYTKTIDFKGAKAIEHCKKDNSSCSITYFTGKRFMVVLDGRNMHPDGLKQAADELRIKG